MEKIFEKKSFGGIRFTTFNLEGRKGDDGPTIANIKRKMAINCGNYKKNVKKSKRDPHL